MLKKPASFVLDSSKSSTYPGGYASGFDSPAALLNGLFEHPEVGLTARPLQTRRMLEGRQGEMSNQTTTPSEATPLPRFALNHLQKNQRQMKHQSIPMGHDSSASV